MLTSLVLRPFETALTLFSVGLLNLYTKHAYSWCAVTNIFVVQFWYSYIHKVPMYRSVHVRIAHITQHWVLSYQQKRFLSPHNSLARYSITNSINNSKQVIHFVHCFFSKHWKYLLSEWILGQISSYVYLIFLLTYQTLQKHRKSFQRHLIAITFSQIYKMYNFF